jgi:hypothetical protein
MTTVPVSWRKSSRSGQDTNCVELAGSLDQVRDTKNRTGPVLRGDLAALVAMVKADRIIR